MYTLEELKRIFGDSFYVYCGQYDTEYHIRFLFGSVFVGETKGGESKFLVGNKAIYISVDPWEDRKLSEITPEEQKKAREQDRKDQNDRITRQLKKSKELKQRFDSVPIGRRTTKSQELFAPKLTLIKGGLDD
jgi:hypothetical protein